MRKAIWFAVVCIAIWPSVGFSEDSTSPCGPPGAACAPYFRDLPDIVIGDTGDISGTGTTALRLYRYLNILNLLDPNVVEWRNWGTLGDRSVFLYQPTASEPTIQASRTSAVGGFVNPLTGSEYVGLMGSGIAPGPGANILDAATTFTYLSLMNTDIMTGSPTDAYSATAAVNGMQTVLIPGGDLGDTDLILVGSALPLPTTSPTLIFEAPFVVTTMMDSGDYTTGATDVLFDFQFPGGSAENWAVNTDFGLADFGAATTSIDTTNGGIGWDATGAGGGALGANYGTWYLSDDGVSAKFLIPGSGMDDLVYRVRAGLRSDTTARADTCSWRLLAISYMCVAWQGVQALTIGGDEVDAPISTDSSFEAQIHFTPPYSLSEWGDAEALDTTDWVAAGDAYAPADGRDYCLTFDGLDVGDDGHLWMDYCIVESYPRPVDAATPDLAWGAGATPFDHPTEGFHFPTTSPFSYLALLPSGDAGTKGPDFVTLTMGEMPGGPDTGLFRWSQAAQNPTTTTLMYVETAGELLRYTIYYHSPDPNIAPVVRFQTVSAAPRGVPVDSTIWYDAFDSSWMREHLANSDSVDAPGTPRTAASGGSTIDVYRYAMRTVPGRWLHFYWDAYGWPERWGWATKGWADQTGAITVTSIVLNGNLPNP